MDERCYREYNRMEREHWWFQARRRVLGNVLDRLATPSRRPRILDLGCGTGESVRHLTRFGRVVALDLSDTALGFCRNKKLPRLVRADAARLPFADAAFDLVCALDLLEHIADEHAALAEIRRVCRPGGHVLLTVPALRLLWSRHDLANHHRRRYRRPQLAAAMAAAGLQRRWITYFNTFLFPPTLVARLAGRCAHRLLSPRPPEMDLACTQAGPFKPLLRWIFALEGRLVGRVPLPVGVSLLCLARRPATPALAPAAAPAAGQAAWARSILDRFIRPPRPGLAAASPAVKAPAAPLEVRTSEKCDPRQEEALV